MPRIAQLGTCLGVVIPLICWATPALGQLTPDRLYYGINRAMPMSIVMPEPASEPLEVRLLEPRTWKVVERASVTPGQVNLDTLFPILWTSLEPRLLYAQLYEGQRGIGPPVVLQALFNPAPATDELTARLRDAALSSEAAKALEALGSLTPSAKEELRRTVKPGTPSKVYSGIRAYSDCLIVLETSEGDIRLGLRPDAAPNTTANFIRLVEGGAYTGVVFHRVVGTPPGSPKNSKGFIIQSGDPTGTGEGTFGECTDFEPSRLEHRFGVVSMARREDDPNTLSSQFFICLSREACAVLDGQYTSFAEVISGADVVDAIATTPVGPRDPTDPLSPVDRPLHPPEIRRAYAVPAPPAGRTPLAVEPVESPQPGTTLR